MGQNAVLYEDDYYAWTVEQAQLLRAGDLSAVDAANIAEEIESMGRSDRRELPASGFDHAFAEMALPTLGEVEKLVRDDRRAAASDRNILSESPSLQPLAGSMLPQSLARERGIAETGLADDMFPATCPFTLVEVLSRSFLPER